MFRFLRLRRNHTVNDPTAQKRQIQRVPVQHDGPPGVCKHLLRQINGESAPQNAKPLRQFPHPSKPGTTPQNPELGREAVPLPFLWPSAGRTEGFQELPGSSYPGTPGRFCLHSSTPEMSAKRFDRFYVKQLKRNANETPQSLDHPQIRFGTTFRRPLAHPVPSGRRNTLSERQVRIRVRVRSHQHPKRPKKKSGSPPPKSLFDAVLHRRPYGHRRKPSHHRRGDRLELNAPKRS
mmetsp:Transcript_3210/g.4572  ORF Transcript_3210/g.4572 Transcript_3210/m.4572 type:complete len:235 (-) Transcript_3210:2060-2764(-)